MPDATDMALVREFAEHNSEPAFAELAHRHINLVYSVAWRIVGNPTDAQDVAQAVFIILAQKTASLREGTVLTGWLYETTRFTALRLLRTRARQQTREQEAYMQAALNEGESDNVWNQLAPLLEEAMARLSERDRTLLALRFFENKTGAETAALLGIQEWAARKRADRALDKLRNFFSKRGVNSTATGIAAAMSAHSIQPAPLALAASVTAAAMAKGAAASASTLTLIKGALKIMAWTKTKTAVVTTVIVLLTGGAATVAVKALYEHRPQASIQGAWEGTLVIPPGAKLRLVLNVKGAGHAYHGTIDSIDQRSKDIPISKFDYDSPTVKLESKLIAGTFEGKINASATEMSGTWKQLQQTAPLVLKRTTTPTLVPELLTESDYAPRPSSDLQGYWKGTVKAGPTDLRLAFKLSEATEGNYVGELDSLDQGVNSMVVSSVTYDKPTVRMEINAVAGTFEGKLNKDEIIGTWSQLGQSMPLTIKRGDPKADEAAASAQDSGTDFSPTGPNDLAGHWKGALDVQGMKLHLALHVGRNSNGDFAGMLDSIDQGAKNIPATTVRFKAPTTHLEWQTIGGTYDGKVANGKISGKWKQGGQAFALVFTRSKE